MNLKLLSIAAALWLSIAAAPYAEAGGGGFVGATEVTQLLNHAELISTLAEDVTQTAQQLQMIQNLYANTTGIPIQAWGSIANHLGQLVQTVSSAMGASYAAGDALNQVEGFYGNGTLMDNYQGRLSDWNASTRSQIAAVLNQFGLQANRFASTQSALQQIQNASQSATGRMQVLQAGNQIAGLMVNQIQDLNATVMAAEQARLNYVAVQNAKDEQDRQHQLRWLGGARGNY